MSNEQSVYRHTHVGYVTGGALAAGAVLSYFSFMAESGRLGTLGVAMVGGLGIGAVLFSSLTVEVSEEALTFYFGPGFWTKRIPREDITRAEVVRNSPMYGWGIRCTLHGWLYNVSGLQAVELDVQGQGTIRIGTDEPEELKAALEESVGVV